MISTSIFCIIVYEFGYWKKFSQIILIIIDKGSKIDLYNIILSLSLAIGQSIEGHWELLLDIKKLI